jgi:hypothetical protein
MSDPAPEPTIEERSTWMAQTMEEDPEALELRERTYPWTHVHPFGILKHANYTCCRSHLDRHRVLELVYQHLHSIGMHHAAFTLHDESQLEFQRKDQNMDRTDLRLLVSMSLGPRDELWDQTGIDGTVLVEEPYDDDNGSVNHVEPTDGYASILDRPSDNVVFASGGPPSLRSIRFAPLRNLIIFLIGFTNSPLQITSEDKCRFFLTLNSICRSEHLFEHLQALHGTESRVLEKDNVLKFVEEWITFSRSFMGRRTIRSITIFLQTIDSPVSIALQAKIPLLVGGGQAEDVRDRPPPDIQEADRIKLLYPTLSLADPSPKEVARQISLVMQKLLAAIHPREFYSAISNRTLSLETPGINELFEFGRKVKYSTVAALLTDPKAPKIEPMIKIVNELLLLNNFEGVSWFLSAFRMKMLKRFELEKEVVRALPQFAELFQAGRDLPSYDWSALPPPVYVDAVLKCKAEGKPAVQNMRYELAIRAAKGYGGTEFEKGSVNWEKRERAAEFIVLYHTFQNTPYNFYPIAQIQAMLSRERSKEKLQEALAK